jgi:MOSC domain-containing protein YiiM
MLKSQREKRLRDRLPQVGRVDWIGRAPVKRGPIEPCTEIRVESGTGIEGDHHATGRQRGSQRQVTLIQAEHLPVIAALSGHETVSPDWLRRNIVVSGIPLLGLLKKKFQIGDAVLQTTGLCDPCHLMEERLGPGGFNAMQGHGGITAVVVEGGSIKIGDSVRIPTKG